MTSHMFYVRSNMSNPPPRLLDEMNRSILDPNIRILVLLNYRDEK